MLAGGMFFFIPSIIEVIDILSMIDPPLDLNKIFEMVLMARSGYILAVRLVTGMAMVVGGGWGIWSAIQSAVTGDGEDLMKRDTSR
jgi:hypothetical protein